MGIYLSSSISFKTLGIWYKLIESVDCIPVKGQEGLFILPGHIGLAEYDVDLGIAQNLSGAIQSLQNVPGAMSFLFQKTAEKFNADYILIDLSPSLGAINQNLVMTSNFLIIPTYPDLFSLMAIDSLMSILPKWYTWAVQASSLNILKEAYYPFPDVTLQFLGTIVQNYKKDSLSGGIEVATKSFQKWIDEINEAVSKRLVPSLRDNNMMLPDYLYTTQGIDSNNFCLAKMADFGALITKSQEYKTPIFALTADQLGWSGNLFSITLKAKEKFNEVFLKLAEKVINLTNDAVSH